MMCIVHTNTRKYYYSRSNINGFRQNMQCFKYWLGRAARDFIHSIDKSMPLPPHSGCHTVCTYYVECNLLYSFCHALVSQGVICIVTCMLIRKCSSSIGFSLAI